MDEYVLIKYSQAITITRKNKRPQTKDHLVALHMASFTRVSHLGVFISCKCQLFARSAQTK